MQAQSLDLKIGEAEVMPTKKCGLTLEDNLNFLMQYRFRALEMHCTFPETYQLSWYVPVAGNYPDRAKFTIAFPSPALKTAGQVKETL